jgi:hypothetical protein
MIDFILISAEKTINKNIIRFNCNVIPNNKTVYIYIDVDTGVVLKSSYPEGSFLEGSMRNFVMEIYELSQNDIMLKNVDLMNRLLPKKPVFCDVLPIETAPKGGCAEMVTDTEQLARIDADNPLACNINVIETEDKPASQKANL